MAALLAAWTVSAGGADEEFSRWGADSCVICHGQTSPLPANGIFFGKHVSATDPKAPFAQLQCEQCHGASEEHARAQRQGMAGLPPIRFGQDSPLPGPEQNAVCLSCHENRERHAWFGSAHEIEGVACGSCHRIHAEHDPAFDPALQQQACFSCHPRQRAAALQMSSHPLRFGNMGCSDCHDPHDGDHEFLLRRATVNETCAYCHAEKRGPFLWEHAPASEDCTLCHKPHGSNHPALLTRRPPLLCQQCHAPAGHPSVAYGGEAADDGFNNRFVLGRACLNCHSQVHGSNHPSGAKLHR